MTLQDSRLKYEDRYVGVQGGVTALGDLSHGLELAVRRESHQFNSVSVPHVRRTT